ncbi:MAG: transporter substrate-binding domain-containing protein [Acetobacteraceae bacterium]|nr:transporter substrate-binding domain-containing protein [Acetobacteraceae bacterium]
MTNRISWTNRRGVFALAAAAAMVAASRGATARPLDQVLSTKTLRAGINPTLPPFGTFNEKNEIDGFDVDIAREIARIMQVNLEVVRVGSPDRIPFLQADRIDIVLGSITRLPARALVIDFTMPLHTQTMGVLSVEGKGIEKLADLDRDSVNLVQVRGTIGIPWIERNAPKAKVTLLDNYPDAIRTIAQGRADAMVDVVESVVIPIRQFRNVRWKILDEAIDSTWVPIGVQKGNYSLRDALNVILFELHKNGFVNRTWQKWFDAPMKTPIPFNPMF